METMVSLGLQMESHERGPRSMWHCSKEKDARVSAMDPVTWLRPWCDTGCSTFLEVVLCPRS